MSTFQFKRFSVQNEKSAMKVNTDSVLLGSWAEIPRGAKTGLDIGSGTGILSLMLAQRSSDLSVIGIEIEKNAFQETEFNFKSSLYKTRLKSVNLPLQEFVSDLKFDCIITNPPYFQNDLKNKSKNKTTARHTDSLSFQDIITFVEKHLSDTGNFSLVLPLTESESFRSLAQTSSLFLTKIAFVKPNINKNTNRVLMCFGLTEETIQEEEFCVYKAPGVYSKEHHELTKDFYLDK